MNRLLRNALTSRRVSKELIFPGGGGEPSETLLGVGSVSTSLVDYPKTGPVTVGDWYVDPNAGTNGSGSLASPFNNMGSAFSAASGGDTILVKAGTINLTTRITRTTSYSEANPLKVFAYGTDRVTLDGSSIPSGSTSSQILRFANTASWEHWKGFNFVNGKGIGVAVLAPNIKLEDCYFHDITVNDTVGGAALRIQDGTSTNCILQDLVFWRIGDPTNGSLGTNQPDCIQFTSVNGVVTSGHKLVRTFMRDGPDDCVDLFRGANIEIIDTVAVNGGRFWTGASGGDGSNFKMGGTSLSAIGNSSLVGCLSIEGRSESIKPNSAPNRITALRTTQVDAENYGFNFSNVISGDKHVVTDCIEFNSGNGSSPGMSAAYVTATFNSWNLGISNPLFADAANHDYSLAVGSDAIGASSTGGNLGASTVALELAKYWLSQDLT